jgi:hypothetical protein
MRRTAFLLLSGLLAFGAASSAQAQSTPDVTIFSPGFYSSADPDESIRFAWLPENDQDFYRVVFSQYRTFGWETTPYSTRETVLTSMYASPEEIGLTPGTWYWRVCFGWSGDSTCYLDDDIRTLDVNEPEPFLSMAEARSTVRHAIRRRYHVRTRRLKCARVADPRVLCRAYFRRRGVSRSRVVLVRTDGEYNYWSFRAG